MFWSHQAICHSLFIRHCVKTCLNINLIVMLTPSPPLPPIRYLSKTLTDGVISSEISIRQLWQHWSVPLDVWNTNRTETVVHVPHCDWFLCPSLKASKTCVATRVVPQQFLHHSVFNCIANNDCGKHHVLEQYYHNYSVAIWNQKW